MNVIAFDGYNVDSNVNSFKTITAGRTDTHHVPVACYEMSMDEANNHIQSVCLCLATGQPNAEITDGKISPTLTHLAGTGGNNVPMVIINSSGNGISSTLDSHYYKGCGEREGIEREFILIYEAK